MCNNKDHFQGIDGHRMRISGGKMRAPAGHVAQLGGAVCYPALRPSRVGGPSILARWEDRGPHLFAAKALVSGTLPTFWSRHRRLYLSQAQNYQRMDILFVYALKMGEEGMFCSSLLQVKWLLRYDDLCHHSGVARMDPSIFWSAIVMQQVINSTLSYLQFEKCEKLLK